MRLMLIVLTAAAAMACSDTPTSPTTVDTDTLLHEFSSNVVPGGSASRSFDIAGDGAITITLKSTIPAGVAVGLGVGIARSNGSCALAAAIETVAGADAQISIAAEKGTYCAKVYDLGTLTDPLPFTIGISHP
jgi:hypothetical protein